MDKIIRSYWIAWDNSNGTDDEKVFTAAQQAAAWDYYRKLAVPYKKLVACYQDRDVTLSTTGIKELPSGFWSVWKDGEWITAAMPDRRSAILATAR
jgi:hypothetical protein